MKRSKPATDRPLDSRALPREIELKLEIVSGAVDRLFEHPLLARAEPVPDQGGRLHAVYFDTPDLALRRAGLTLRIRRRNGHHTQTIKAEQDSRGLALDRSEWESPVEDGAIDFGAVAGTPLAALMADASTRETIKPAFSIETKRRAFKIRHDGALIELALDDAKPAPVAGSCASRNSNWN